jgi:RNA polymerase sigma factor (sigma-70 family)
VEKAEPEERPAIEGHLERLRANPGDDRAWTDVFAHYRRSVLAVLYMLGVREPAEREDLASEVFFRFLCYSPWREDWSSLPDHRVIADYLRTIAVNVTATARRRAAREREHLNEYRAAADTAVHAPDAAIADSLDLLAPQERRFFLDFYEQGLSLSQLASTWNISYTAAGTRLHRIRKRLIRIYRQDVKK